MEKSHRQSTGTPGKQLYTSRSLPRPEFLLTARRTIALAAAGLLLLLVSATAGALAWFTHADLAPYAARYASAKLGRPVSIGALTVGWNGGAAITLQDLRMDNIAGGSASDMVSLRRLNAVIGWRSIVSGPLTIQSATIDGLTILLEHVASGAANWKFTGPPNPGGPPDLTGLPTVLAAVTRDVTFTFRTRGGSRLETKITSVSLTTEGADKPVSIIADGTYNGAPAHIDGTFESFNRLRQVPAPYQTDIRINSEDAVLDFKGTMTDPLNFDGVKGALDIDLPQLSDLQDAAGISIDANVPASLQGILTKTGDDWRLADGHGTIDDEAYTLSGRMLEGGGGQPDDITVSAAFDRLDLGLLSDGEPKLDKGAKAPRTQRSASIPLYVEDKPGTLVDATVTAKQAVYHHVTVSDAALHVRVRPKTISVDSLSLLYAGTRAVLSGGITQTGPVARLDLSARAVSGDLGSLLKAVGAGPVPLSGPFDARVTTSMTGSNVMGAMKGARTTALVTMTGGSLSNNVIEIMSLNAKRLFRKPKGASAIACLLGALDMNGLTGRLRPLRIRTADGTLAGVGSFDLAKQSIDMTIGSLRPTTNFFALDIPIVITGTLDNPRVRPAGRSSQRDRLFSGDELGFLPPAQQAAARANACLAGR
jgi:uncharacterized protein involved in outer membrane biogenesis